MGQPYFDFGELSSILADNTYRPTLVFESVKPTGEQVESVCTTVLAARFMV